VGGGGYLYPGASRGGWVGAHGRGRQSPLAWGGHTMWLFVHVCHSSNHDAAASVNQHSECRRVSVAWAPEHDVRAFLLFFSLRLNLFF
jgi:hypothetical protein